MIPVRPAGLVLEGHGVVVSGGRIEALLPEKAARAQWPSANVVELFEHVLMPGLINMHTHSPMTLLRGCADDLELHAWLNDYIWPAEKRHVSAQFVADGTRLAIAEMIRGGTTCFNDNYFHPDETARVAKEVGMRAVVGLPLLDQPSSWARDFDEYLGKGLEVVEQFGSDSSVTFTLAPHAPYSVSDSALQRIAEVSRKLRLKIHLHCLESSFDVDHSYRTYGKKPLERLSSHGILNRDLIAVHMTQLDGRDIAKIAGHGVHVVHCPQSNLKLASGVCPVHALVSAGVNVCIGTDGAASNNNLDLLEEVRTAALLAKGASGDPTALNAVQAIQMLTINAARALGLEAEIGSIESGKAADLCALNLSHVCSQPVHDVHSQIVYAASSHQITDVWIAGERLLSDGELMALDESSAMAAAEDWRRRIQSAADSRQVVM